MSEPADAARDLPITGSWGSGPATWSILVHGGAGDVPDAAAAKHVAGCERAAAEGARVLAAGGSALDAVQRAVEVLESDPLFNAGTGACLDHGGHLSLDASLMDGEGLRAGAVAALPAFEHPIAIARRVMDDTPHVLFAGAAAGELAVAMGFAPADEAAMITDAARQRWESARKRSVAESWAGGTVGAVARDAQGHVAAATSTGGMVNKMRGRVGDSPLIGAGTYADDERGACSTTGHGEAMMRIVAAKSVVDGMVDAAPEASARATLSLMHARTAQTGGVIAVGRDGTVGLARTTRTMTWAHACSKPDAPDASGA
ncbi:MAG: L-asparaginase [Labilithrix sp.]|nr:L-asparaginase [Labilithrix sp.]